jgi:purine-nucleoside phosphorylase
MIHIKCKEVAPLALVVGDPGRAKLVAESFLEESLCISEHRGLLCYTGKYKGEQISVLTTGMGSPSFAIVFEEAVSLGAKVVLRVGTCGAVQPEIKVGDLVIPTAATPLCGILQSYGIERLPPVPNHALLFSLIEVAREQSVGFHIGIICTSDAFYKEREDALLWSKRNVLAFEMECAALFALSYIKKIKAAAVLAVTGNILKGEQVLQTPSAKKGVEDAIRVALEAIIKCKHW